MGSDDQKRVPHYALRTITNSAPEFANQEQDVIRQSFSTGNHTWMKETLPVELGPDSINLLRRQRMERNRLAEPIPQTWTKMTQLWGGGYYQEFEYIPDTYSSKGLADVLKREHSLEKQSKISTKGWMNVSQERRLKHEALLPDPDPQNKEHFPYLGGDYDAEEETLKTMLKSRGGASRSGATGVSWNAEENSFLTGKGKGLEDNSRGSRMTLPTMVMRLQKRVESDWEGTTVVVSATDQDLIQIAFHMGSVDSERGVTAYMSVLSRDSELLGSFGLRKVSQLWGMKRDFSAELDDSGVAADVKSSVEESADHTWMFFLLMPKWVRMRPTDAYYTIHPRSQGSAFRMSTAGSSVLLSLGSAVVDDKTVKRQERQEQPRKAASAAAPVRAQALPGDRAQKLQLELIEKAVSMLPAIREGAAHSAR